MKASIATLSDTASHTKAADGASNEIGLQIAEKTLISEHAEKGQ
jgi:hypothetical protein